MRRKLADWARDEGMSYGKALWMWKHGTLPAKAEQERPGTAIYVIEDDVCGGALTTPQRDWLIEEADRLGLCWKELIRRIVDQARGA